MTREMTTRLATTPTLNTAPREPGVNDEGDADAVGDGLDVTDDDGGFSA